MWDYSQTNDPGAVGAGKTWFHPTSGNIKVRNTANSGWNMLGNVDIPNTGNVPVTGASMSGPLTGLTGIAASDAHDFPTSVRKGGVELATMNDLSSMQNTLYSNMSEKINEIMAGYAKSGSPRESVATRYGEVSVYSGHADNFAIVLQKPVYSDGVSAKDNECMSIAALVDINVDTTATSIKVEIIKVDEVNYKIRTLKNGAHDGTITCRIGYIVTAVRQ